MPHSHPHSPRSVCRKLQRANPPRGFTLVELMVVIGIIGLLTAISVPIVMQSLAKARNAAIKAEIDMLHMAIMNYKNEYGSFPPCVDLASTRSHIQRIFPRCNASTECTQAPTQQTALVGWLGGFTDDPQHPLTIGTRKKLYDFDTSRISLSNSYHPSGKANSPFIYTNSSQYFLSRTATRYSLRDFVEVRTTEDQNNNRQLDSGEDVNGNGLLDIELFNPDSFQIICAGRDEVIGTDDDLSNFWPGTKREYLDSLRN